jgi:hypothetical protein
MMLHSSKLCSKSVPKKNHGDASVKDKAKKILADSVVGASGDLLPQIRSSFLER